MAAGGSLLSLSLSISFCGDPLRPHGSLNLGGGRRVGAESPGYLIGGVVSFGGDFALFSRNLRVKHPESRTRLGSMGV